MDLGPTGLVPVECGLTTTVVPGNPRFPTGLVPNGTRLSCKSFSGFGSRFC